ncbi:MAG: GGDEF domain-containing protein [Myxococcales bacterium]|nr:GGDEF domain-containing protein [Myxococcales bacterium]
MVPGSNANDQMEDLQRKLSFSEAVADPLDFDQLLARASALLSRWAQSDVVTLILPPDREGVEPLLHIFGRQPVLPLAERSIRDDCALLLAEMDFAHLPGEALRLRRGPELMPLHQPVRDDTLYRFWSHELVIEDQIVGIVALYGFTDWLLSPRIKRLLGGLMPPLARAVSTAASVARLRRAGHKDESTGVYNRRGFVEQVERECARATATGHAPALLLLDVEDLASSASTAEGVGVLRAMTEALAAAVRPFDVIGRFGEEEFVVLLPETSVDEATAVAERILDLAGQLSFHGRPLQVNIGASLYGGGTIDALFQAADEALYQARRQGALQAAGG